VELDGVRVVLEVEMPLDVVHPRGSVRAEVARQESRPVFRRHRGEVGPT
jgi:hypothetical protein